MRMPRGRRCVRSSVHLRCRCLLGSVGCGFWSGWKARAGPTGALLRSRLAPGRMGGVGGGCGDVVGGEERLRAILRERLGVARQEVLAAGAARMRLLVRAVSEVELAGALTQASQAGFDLSREVPLRAHLFALG